jgi:outer membrane protein assembly factor BamE (lipoprotein component of BamABCDE complex)
MKVILTLIISFSFTGCALMNNQATYPASRYSASDMSDLDTLEKLLLNEQQSAYESRRRDDNLDLLRLGMKKRNVQRRMGRPDAVEVAGNPKYGNERWIYERSVPTLNGTFQETQVIYFEGGSVVGWESH